MLISYSLCSFFVKTNQVFSVAVSCTMFHLTPSSTSIKNIAWYPPLLKCLKRFQQLLFYFFFSFIRFDKTTETYVMPVDIFIYIKKRNNNKIKIINKHMMHVCWEGFHWWHSKNRVYYIQCSNKSRGHCRFSPRIRLSRRVRDDNCWTTVFVWNLRKRWNILYLVLERLLKQMEHGGV
jgi:hypothetical protein